jgi:hypothetical protein
VSWLLWQPAELRFKIEGAEPRVNASGDLVLKTAAGEVRQRRPIVYQGARRIEGGFVVHGRRVSFEVAAYDRSRLLVIDPVLVYSTTTGQFPISPANTLVVGGIKGKSLWQQFSRAFSICGRADRIA